LRVAAITDLFLKKRWVNLIPHVFVVTMHHHESSRPVLSPSWHAAEQIDKIK
jgi:hypothetical protein